MLCLALSRLGRTELLELRLLLARCASGSAGCRPEDLAKRFRMSVRDTTPVKRPDTWAPGIAAAGGDEKLWLVARGECGADSPPEVGTSTVGVEQGLMPVPCPVEVVVAEAKPALELEFGRLGVRSGVEGPLGDGDADSTTHMRWLCVATSFATVWARVETGVT